MGVLPVQHAMRFSKKRTQHISGAASIAPSREVIGILKPAPFAEAFSTASKRHRSSVQEDAPLGNWLPLLKSTINIAV